MGTGIGGSHPVMGMGGGMGGMAGMTGLEGMAGANTALNGMDPN